MECQISNNEDYSALLIENKILFTKIVFGGDSAYEVKDTVIGTNLHNYMIEIYKKLKDEYNYKQIKLKLPQFITKILWTNDQIQFKHYGNTNMIRKGFKNFFLANGDIYTFIEPGYIPNNNNRSSNNNNSNNKSKSPFQKRNTNYQTNNNYSNSSNKNSQQVFRQGRQSWHN